MKLKFHFLIPIFALLCAQIPVRTSAGTCNDIEFIFARGSGSELGATNYQTYHNAIVRALGDTTLKYDFYELGTSTYGGYSYPAVPVGAESFNNFTNALGALVGGGTSYNYGKSITSGVKELQAYIKEVHSRCANTKFVLAGYSQGAQVISTALPYLNSSLVFYAATFGDPKLYLPEGQGLRPLACQGKSLSPYRAYVPDCYAHEGILGGLKPYQTSTYQDGQLGAWCIYHDIMCSSYIDLSDPITSHLNYKIDGMYENAANIIAEKLAKVYPSAFSIPVNYSGYDVVLMFDTTDSMTPYIEGYKAYALEIAKKVLMTGGRLAFYDYRDLNDAHTGSQLCNFDECTESKVSEIIDELTTGEGGDSPESLMSNLKKAMNEVLWQQGAKKTVVVLTNSNFHNPDRDGVTANEVVELSKNIDPVNIYIVAPERYRTIYEWLGNSTGGEFFVYGKENEVSASAISENLIIPTFTEPEVSVENLTLESLSTDSVKLNFETNSARVYVVLNDMVLGYTESTELTITDLDPSTNQSLLLVPYSKSGKKGIATSATIKFVQEQNPETDPEEGEGDPAADDPKPSENPKDPATDEPEISGPEILAPKTGWF